MDHDSQRVPLGDSNDQSSDGWNILQQGESVQPGGAFPLWGGLDLAQPDRDLLFGRDNEIGDLDQTVKGALAGAGGLALIAGEAGIGKSTLVQRMTDDIGPDEATVLTGHCYDLETTPPYGPWIDLFRSAAFMTDMSPPLGSTVAPGSDESQPARGELFGEIWSFLEGLTAERPLVLILEDMHWADHASLDLLQVLIHQVREQPILIVATYRDAELVPDQPLYQRLPGLVREGPALRLSLRRLGSEAILGLVEARYPTLPPSDVARLSDHLERYSQGNPLFIDEILYTLEFERVLNMEQDEWRLSSLEMPPVPPLVQQMMEGRMQSLDERSRELLQVAAVLGVEISLELWQEVTEASDEELVTALEHGLAARVLEEMRTPAGVRFRHAMLREVLYRDLAVTTRQIWHRRAGEVLAEQGEPEPMSIAHHFIRADDDRAVEWLILSGQIADYTSAFSSSIDSYEQALTLLERDPERQGERGWLLCAVSEALRHSDPQRALVRVEEAQAIAAHVGDAALEAIALRTRSHLRGYLGENGLDELNRSVDAYEALSETDKQRIAESPLRYTVSLGTYSQRLAYYGSFEQARSRALEYLDGVGGQQGLATEKLIGLTYFGLAWALAALGERESAQQTFKRSRSYNRALNNHYLVVHAHRYEYVSLLHVYLPELVQERRRLINVVDEHFELLQESHFSDEGQVLRLSSALILDGRWQEAYEDANSQMHLESLEIDCAAVLAQLDWLQGRSHRAWIHIHSVLPQGPDAEPSTPYFLETLQFQRIAAELAMDDGDLELARRWIEALERWQGWSDIVYGEAAPHLLWARYHELRNEIEQARDRSEKALEEASRPRQPLDRIAALRVLARLDAQLGDMASAGDHAREAHSIATTCEAPYEIAQVELVQAEIAMATGDLDQARTLLSSARTTAERLEAGLILDAIARMDDQIAASRETPELAVGLTRREIQVLRLVAQGLSDAEIGEALFISPRTASGHLQSIYNKLDVNSRTAATAFAFANKLV